MAYSNIKDPSAHFQTAIYTGSNNQSITNDGNSDLQPDFAWIKRRSNADHHSLTNSSTGVNKQLSSSLTSAEQSRTDQIQSFNTDGFTLGTDGAGYTNVPGNTYVAWQWKANGGTTSSNTDGTITSTVQANTDAGFSIVTWAGTASTATIGHGLGVAPKVVIVRARDKGVPTSWIVFHKDGSTSDDDYFILQGTFAKGSQAGLWNNQYPSSTVFGVANDFWVNSASTNYVAYCFAEKQGYSKFGTYVGNLNVDGPFVYTGFKPAWIMIKRAVGGTSTYSSWGIHDSKRLSFNSATGGSKVLWANANYAEGTRGQGGSNTGATARLDILSNGFKIRDSGSDEFNDPNDTYIYMAFAESPFVAGGIPTTAR